MLYLYIFWNFCQPGIFFQWPASTMPMMYLSAGMVCSLVINSSGITFWQILRNPIMKALLFFIFVQVISVYYSGIRSILSELGYWYIYPVFCFLVVKAISTTRVLKRVVWSMIIGALPVVAYGIYSLSAGEYKFRVGGSPVGWGMYENHNDYTFLTLLVLPFAWKLIAKEDSRFRKMVLFLTCILCVIGTILSLSRGGAIVLFVCVLLLLKPKKMNIRFALAAGLLTICAFTAVAFVFNQREAIQGTTYSAEDAREGRFDFWITGLLLLRHNPFLGVGSRRYYEYAGVRHNSHNTFVEVASNTGLLGIGAYLAMIIFMLRQSKILLTADDRLLAGIMEATRIAIIAFLFRANLDAKVEDWNIYFLACLVIAGSNIAVRLSPRTGPY